MSSPQRQPTRTGGSGTKKKARSASPARTRRQRSASTRRGSASPSRRPSSPSRRPSSPSKSSKRGRSSSRRRKGSGGSGSSPHKPNATLGGTMTFQPRNNKTKKTATMNNTNGQDESVAFCRKVKRTFHHRPKTYRQFVKIMGEIQDERSDTVEIIKRVILLFDGYPDLVREFNQFLPMDYRIEMQGDAVLVKVYDEVDEETIGLVETGTLATLGQNGTMTYGPGSRTGMSTLGGPVTTAKSDDVYMGNTMGSTQFGTQTLGPNKDATVEYIKRVKHAFTDKPRVYRRFMDALRAYHKEEADVLETIKRVVALFQNHTDLVLGFNEFLPQNYRIRMFHRNGYTIQHPSMEQEDEVDSFQIMLDDRFA